MDYVLIASILFYVSVVQLTVKFNLKITTSALLAVLLPFALGVIVKEGIVLIGQGLQVGQSFTLASLILLAIQFCVAIGIFYKLEQNEEATGMWLIWAAFGAVLLFLVVPYLFRMAPF